MSVETIKLKCRQCHEIVERKKHCPYTGIEHGRGWRYVCVCRGEMDIVPDETIIDVLVKACDTLDRSDATNRGIK